MKNILEDIYDTIFKNDQYKLIDFCEAFPDSFIDLDTNAIYLSGSDKYVSLKITIEEC